MREQKGKSIISFPSDYTVIDIETTGLSPECDSILELAAVKVRNNCVVGEFSSLVREYDGIILNGFITSLTGISQKMIDNAPYTEDTLKYYLEFLGDDILLGHNVSFDVNFIYDNAERFYDCPLRNDFIDTMRIDRKLYKEEKHHRLCDISERFHIDYTHAHRASVDCYITKTAYDKLRDVINNTVGEEAFIDSFKDKRVRHRAKVKYEHLKPEEIEPDEENLLYGKTCVITGELERFTRTEALRAIEKIGGLVGKNVTKSTNYLILGNNDYCSSIKDGKSSKQKKAELYRLKGVDIEIIPENVFYEMLGVDD